MKTPGPGSYVATLYFVVLFIPLFPIACYRVIPRGGSAWSFLGKVPYSKREKRHWIAFAMAVAVLLFWNSASSSGSAGSSTSTYIAPAAITPSPTSSATEAGAANPTPTYAPSYAAPQVSNSSRVESEPYWYQPEKSNVEMLEASVQALDAQLASSESEIERLKRQIRAIEGGYGVYSTSDPEYERLIDRHNAGVRNYNDLLLRRRLAYREYNTALDAFNQHVDDYNSRRR